MKKFLLIALILATTLPEGVFAASRTFKDLANSFYDILGGLVPIIVALAIVAFLFGVQKYIMAGPSEEKFKEGRNMMIYGIVGIFVMVSVWGLVRIVIRTFFGADVSNTSPSTFYNPNQ